MYLQDDVKKQLSKRIGIPYEKLITMDDDEITKYIENKNGTKIGWSKSINFGSGDDSILIDKGRLFTREDSDKRIDEIIKKCKAIKTNSENEEVNGLEK